MLKRKYLLLKGMKQTTRLTEVQLPAVAWMVKREHSIASPCGGILCDDTGMGKTIMTLALIVGNPQHPITSESGAEER